MESPIKKLSFAASNKENAPLDADLASLEAQMDAKHAEKKQETPVQHQEEKQELMEEPLLKENPQRFVLFPIKYHEVSRRRVPHAPRRVKWFAC